MEGEREVMEAAMEAGHILLENGAEIFRVEETINRICRHYGITSSNAFILSNGIFATSGNAREETFAKVLHIPVSGAHLNRVAAVNQLSREIEEDRYTIEEGKLRLEQIRTMPGKSRHMLVLGSGAGSGAFCYLYGGSLIDCLAAFLVGLLVYVFVIFVSSPYLSKMVSGIAGGAVATMACMLLFYLGIGEHLNQMVIGSIIPLVPGVAFTNAIRDIADENYIAGAVRMLDAMLVFFGIAMGVGFVFTIVQRIVGGGML